ncbi:ORF6N domain-containing protein [Pseudoduganella sp. R-34]|uniref:ORF6N domain-containing protein n=1 Tax=Pseudoduganella sp. R-34 TaxID=3404062 RepID=UPI003CF24D43
MTRESIAGRILVLRRQRVMLDADLAELYGVPTKALNQAVRRNSRRFPPDFMFQLTTLEKREVVTNCDHLARLKFARTLPFAFTEHGSIQASNVLNTGQAIEMGLYVVRAFLHLRELVAAHDGLAARLDELAALVARGQESTRVELKAMVDVLRQLARPAEAPAKRPIGFVVTDERPASAAAAAPAPGRGRKPRAAPGASGR